MKAPGWRLLPLVLALGLLAGCGMGVEGILIDRAMLEFNLGLSAEEVVLEQGGEATVTVSVSYVIPLYARPVTVKLLDPPDGVTAKDVEVFADRGVLRLRAERDAPLTAEPVTLTLGATNGQVSKTRELALTVVARRP